MFVTIVVVVVFSVTLVALLKTLVVARHAVIVAVTIGIGASCFFMIVLQVISTMILQLSAFM